MSEHEHDWRLEWVAADGRVYTPTNGLKGLMQRRRVCTICDEIADMAAPDIVVDEPWIWPNLVAVKTAVRDSPEGI